MNKLLPYDYIPCKECGYDHEYEYVPAHKYHSNNVTKGFSKGDRVAYIKPMYYYQPLIGTVLSIGSYNLYYIVLWDNDVEHSFEWGNNLSSYKELCHD